MEAVLKRITSGELKLEDERIGRKKTGKEREKRRKKNKEGIY